MYKKMENKTIQEKNIKNYPLAMQKCETCKHSLNYDKNCARVRGSCSCGMYIPHNFKAN